MTDRPSYAIMGNLKKNVWRMSGYIIHPKFCCSTDKLGRKRERERERETILKPENVNAMQKPNCGTYSSYKMANLDRNGSSFLYL